MASRATPRNYMKWGLEGFVLFALIWLFARKPRPTGQISAVFLMGYGLFRFLVEFTREPDYYLGLLAGGLSMGQLLSLPMVLAGVIIFCGVQKNRTRIDTVTISVPPSSGTLALSAAMAIMRPAADRAGPQRHLNRYYVWCNCCKAQSICDRLSTIAKCLRSCASKACSCLARACGEPKMPDCRQACDRLT